MATWSNLKAGKKIETIPYKGTGSSMIIELPFIPKTLLIECRSSSQCMMEYWNGEEYYYGIGSVQKPVDTSSRVYTLTGKMLTITNINFYYANWEGFIVITN